MSDGSLHVARSRRSSLILPQLRQIGTSALVGLVVLVLGAFFMVRLIPGDPAMRIVGPEATTEQVQDARERLDLDRPLVEQLGSFTVGIVERDLGTSFVSNESVTKIVADRMPKTLQLALSATAVTLVGSITIGLLAGLWTRGGRHPKGEMAFGGATGFIGSVPEYLLATLLVVVFAVWLRWLPIAGATGASSLVLPVAAIAARPTVVLARIVRIETVAALSQDYVLVARSKRLPLLRIATRHVLPNVLTSALSIGGMLLAGLLGGAVIVENIFAWPGLGTKIVSAIISRDYPVVQGIILFLGVCVVLINAFVDILLAVIDPRSERSS